MSNGAICGSLTGEAIAKMLEIFAITSGEKKRKVLLDKSIIMVYIVKNYL